MYHSLLKAHASTIQLFLQRYFQIFTVAAHISTLITDDIYKSWPQKMLSSGKWWIIHPAKHCSCNVLDHGCWMAEVCIESTINWRIAPVNVAGSKCWTAKPNTLRPSINFWMWWCQQAVRVPGPPGAACMCTWAKLWTCTVILSERTAVCTQYTDDSQRTEEEKVSRTLWVNSRNTAVM